MRCDEAVFHDYQSKMSNDNNGNRQPSPVNPQVSKFFSWPEELTSSRLDEDHFQYFGDFLEK
jgi:hypothetical protein